MRDKTPAQRGACGTSPEPDRPREVAFGVPQRWRRSRTSLASLTRAARYVVPPWSGWIFFIRERWARVMSSRSPRAERQGSDKLPLQSFCRRRRPSRSPLPHPLVCSRQPGSRRSRYAANSSRLSASISPIRPTSAARSSASSEAPASARPARGRAWRRCHGRAPFRYKRCGPAIPGRCFSACGRRSPPAIANTQPSKPSPNAPTGTADADLAAKKQKRRKQQRGGAAEARRAAPPVWDRPWRKH